MHLHLTRLHADQECLREGWLPVWVSTRAASVSTGSGTEASSSGDRNSDVAGTVAPSIGSHLRVCDEQMLSIQSGSPGASVGRRAALDPVTALAAREWDRQLR
jgi:hypothetical protein